MRMSAESMNGFGLHALDGDLGQVHGFFFDDASGAVRYLVADTGSWLPGRKVLLSPRVLGRPDGAARRLPVFLTKEQVEESPEIDTDKPVERRQEIALHRHYGWPPYWPESGLYGLPMVPPPDMGADEEPEGEAGDPHLHSTRAIVGYRIEAKDGEIGHVEDFIVDTAGWVVRSLVVDTRKWIPGRKVAVPLDRVRSIDWGDEAVRLDLSREEVHAAPTFDPAAPVNRDEEDNRYDYHGRPVREAGRRKAS